MPQPQDPTILALAAGAAIDVDTLTDELDGLRTGRYPCPGLYIGDVGSTAVVRTLSWLRLRPPTVDCSPASPAGAESGPDDVALTTHDKHRRSPPGIATLPC